MPTQTSPLGSALKVKNLLLKMGNGSSPETMEIIANASDMSMPLMNQTVEVTNFGDQFVRRVATLSDFGKITFKVFWIPEEVTHRNSNANNIEGLRYALLNQDKRDFQFIYPDGNGSTDAFAAYVTSFAITGKVGGVFEASVELSTDDGAPSLV